jgi:hypothetical protein
MRPCATQIGNVTPKDRAVDRPARAQFSDTLKFNISTTDKPHRI